MTNAIAAIVLLHAAALAGVLLMSRYSAVLVDENGRPLARRESWRERVITRSAQASRAVDSAGAPAEK